jgi:hypothetical protein
MVGTLIKQEGALAALRHAYEEAGVTGVPMFVIGEQVLTACRTGKRWRR